VEAERDRWQRPEDIIRALAITRGDIVVDLGCGSGYFATRLAPVVGRDGRVLAVDIRRQPLVFLWIRRLMLGAWQIQVVLGNENDPHIGTDRVDAVLIVNTYHELTNAAAVMSTLHGVLKSGGRLVVADRRPRLGPGASAEAEKAQHRLSAPTPEAEMRRAGFALITRDDAFIDQPDDDPWWLMVFTKP